jgi:archaeal flagellar protein FlaI
LVCGDYEIIREGNEVEIRINCEECNFIPSIEEEPRMMQKTIEILSETKNATKIIIKQRREYEYSYEQTQILQEISNIYKNILNEIETKQIIGTKECEQYTKNRFIKIQDIIYRQLKTDPVSAFVELSRFERDEKIINKNLNHIAISCLQPIYQLLTKIIDSLASTRLISSLIEYIPGHKIGDRTIYKKIFFPTIKPDFMFAKVLSTYPLEGEEIDSYFIGETEVTIFKIPNTTQTLYHVIPPEFKISSDKYEILDAAKNILSEHKPKRSEFVDPERMRDVFSNIGSDLIEELTKQKGIKLRKKEIKELTEILIRHTVGFGMIEILLEDPKIQDITINSPMGKIPMFVVHSEYGDCKTNIMPSTGEGESWASKLRMISGRPLDEANPILDTELILPNTRARVAAVSEPLNPTGISFAFRRHREKPWTLPLFIKNKMITPLAAGIISFLIDGNRTILVAGTRSAGKTSLLGSLMVELMRRGRIICIEDTLELPCDSLRKLGYNIQSLKVASALTRGTTEVSAEEGIRTTLRLGDSSLIVGEVRSTECLALYEAMRVGALANLVAGTIHGDSPYGVFDRVVNDLKVPKTSFKATDIIIVANPIKSPDGIHKWRRVTQITEVRKFWEDDPLKENGFIDLMKYNAKKDELEPTADLLHGESDIIKAIAGNVKEWAGDWDAVWDNILLRTKIKKELVDTAEKTKKYEILEAEFYITANDEFHRITEQVKEEEGKIDSKKIFKEWKEWLDKKVKNK